MFDIGGVVLTWDPRAIAATVFSDHDTQDLVLAQVFGHTDWDELDRGTLSRQDAIERAACRTGLGERDVAALFDHIPLALVPIPGSVDLLHRLKAAGHTLFCLSNMHAASIAHIERAYPFWGLFSGAVVSCRAHMCKPEPGIYAYLLEGYRLDAADTVLIDDMQANLDAAAAFGTHTVRFESAAQCENRLAMLRCI